MVIDVSFHVPLQLCYNSAMSTRDRSAYLLAYRIANREEINARARVKYAADPEKTNARHRAAYAADPAKVLARQKVAYDADPVKFNARVKACYDANPAKERERSRAKYLADPLKHNARTRANWPANAAKWSERARIRHLANPAKRMVKRAKRRATELRATPAWSEADLILAFYAACPPGVHVDHWLPLQGKTVCGLHVLANLQYLTKRENNAKNNKMPDGPLPSFVASEWIKLMLARFYAATETEEALAA